MHIFLQHFGTKVAQVFTRFDGRFTWRLSLLFDDVLEVYLFEEGMCLGLLQGDSGVRIFI